MTGRGCPVDRDKFGVRYRHPERTCVRCRNYPCFDGIEKCKSNFAAYGCAEYRE